MLWRIPLQVWEEGVWYCFRSSSSATEDSKGSAEDTSGSSNREGLNNSSPGKTVRGAGHAGSRLSAGDELIEESRTEEESQVIEKGDGESREAELPAKINGSEKDTPQWKAPKGGDPEGQQPPRIYRPPTHPPPLRIISPPPTPGYRTLEPQQPITPQITTKPAGKSAIPPTEPAAHAPQSLGP